VPNRIIRDSCKTSRSLDVLSDGAERLFFRLTTEADDHGRFDAHPSVILAGCFPLKIGILKPEVIAKRVAELVATDCVRLYEVEGIAYGFFPSWTVHQRLRNKHSRFPEPPAATRGELPPVAADCGDSRRIAATRAPAETETETDINPSANVTPFADQFEEFWKVFPKRRDKEPTRRAYRTARKKASHEEIMAGLNRDISSNDWQKEGGKFIPWPEKWLARERWKEPETHLLPKAQDLSEWN
jgi:hypothetical protein